MSSTTTVQVHMNGRTILDSVMHKLPKSRKDYRIALIVPDNGIPIIEYYQASAPKKPKKCIQFVDMLFADKKHDTNEKFAFSIYNTDETITFLAQDEATMNEWLGKIRECHSNLYPEFKRYDAIFEANLLDTGLAKTMHIRGSYRVALCKESLDLIPLLTPTDLLSSKLQALNPSSNSAASSNQSQKSIATTMNVTHHPFETKLPNSRLNHPMVPATINSMNASTTPSNLNHSLPQHIPHHQRFHKRHPLLSSKTIELVLKSIRRCGHTDCNFYIESGRQSQIGEGDLWMTLKQKPTARQLHELLLATMKLASSTEDQFFCRAPRSRSGSSSDNAHRAQQSRSSSLMCLASDTPVNNNNNNSTISNSNNSYTNYLNSQIQAAVARTTPPGNVVSTVPMLLSNGNNSNNSSGSSNGLIDEDGYLPMA